MQVEVLWIVTLCSITSVFITATLHDVTARKT